MNLHISYYGLIVLISGFLNITLTLWKPYYRIS